MCKASRQQLGSRARKRGYKERLGSILNSVSGVSDGINLKHNHVMQERIRLAHAFSDEIGGDLVWRPKHKSSVMDYVNTTTDSLNPT